MTRVEGTRRGWSELVTIAPARLQRVSLRKVSDEPFQGDGIPSLVWVHPLLGAVLCGIRSWSFGSAWSINFKPMRSCRRHPDALWRPINDKVSVKAKIAAATR